MSSSRPPIVTARMPPSGSSASFITASNSAMTPLKFERGLEDRHRLAADPDALELAVREFELDLDASRAVQKVALDPREARASLLSREQSLLREVGAEQPVGVAAHRILGDAERRAEHARFDQVVVGAGGDREHEIARRPELRRQRREAAEVGLQVLERLGAAHSDE